MVLFAGLVLYATVLIGVIIAALVAGGRWEKVVALLAVLGSIGTQAAKAPGNDWNALQPGVLAVDVVMLGCLVGVAVASTRWWPIWATAAQAAGVLSHICAAVVPNYPRELYLTLQPFWALPVLAALAVGVRSELRQRHSDRWAAHSSRRPPHAGHTS